MIKKYFIIFLFSVKLLAETSHIYKISGKFYKFIDKDSVEVSKNCKNTCHALKKFKALKGFKRQVDKNKFANSLGSYVCSQEMAGSPVVGIDEEKNMHSFCYFSQDESMIEINSLESAVKEKLK